MSIHAPKWMHSTYLGPFVVSMRLNNIEWFMCVKIDCNARRQSRASAPEAWIVVCLLIVWGRWRSWMLGTFGMHIWRVPLPMHHSLYIFLLRQLRHSLGCIFDFNKHLMVWQRLQSAFNRPHLIYGGDIVSSELKCTSSSFMHSLAHMQLRWLFQFLGFYLKFATVAP